MARVGKVPHEDALDVLDSPEAIVVPNQSPNSSDEGETPIAQGAHKVKLLPRVFVSYLPIEPVAEIGVPLEI